LEEWRDPLWVIRFLTPTASFLCLLTVLCLPARADTRHSVFGLNPGLTYDVYVGGQKILSGASPTATGDLSFMAPVSDPVRLVPIESPHFAGAPASCAAGFAVSLPTPNPSTGAFTVRIRLESAENLRVRVIEAATGRQRHEERLHLSPGEHELRIALRGRVASGLYVVRVEVGDAAVAHKLLVLRDRGD